MDECFQLVTRPRRVGTLSDAAPYGLQTAERARAFHASFPEYAPTPLAELSALAGYLDLGGLYVKDESHRFGLNAFKVLGGSFAIGTYIARRLGTELSGLPYDRLTDPELRQKLGELTFITATDGNHGRGVAWTANRLGQKAVVYMPRGSAPERLENIRALGATADMTDLNYDDTVRYARKTAERNGWILVQDTAWPGYEDIPQWIMQGYTTLALEAVEQLRAIGVEKPTHVFLQAGVGSMAGAVAGFFSDLFGAQRPVVTVVEPQGANCLYRTAKADDGQLHAVTGDMHTMMAGLACGEVCPLAWEVLKDHADHFVSCPELIAAKGMRVLGNPLAGDRRVVSGESGAATLGLVVQAMTDPRLRWLREALALSESSKVLCISTEGDTDRANYRRVVWDGLCPSF